ncbi:hypothetical protein ACFL2Y_04470, partial [Candidatus Omnitrophota bacterium]
MKNLSREIRKKRFLAIIPLISFLSITILPLTENLTRLEASEFGMAAELLIQTGISFYDQGRFLDAMNEFKKALVVNPRATVAKAFMKRIQKEMLIESLGEEGVSKVAVIEKALDQAELQHKVLKDT